MTTKTPLATIITFLLLMATWTAFSQDITAQPKKLVAASSKASIESVVPNLARHSISVALANFDPQEDYHLLLYNSDKELISTFSIDESKMTLFVGSLAPNNYALVLLKGKEVIDRKEMLLE